MSPAYEKVKEQAKAWRDRNPERVREYNRRAREKYPERIRESQQRWWVRNRHKKTEYRLLYKYGITPEDVKSMIASQGGLCALCFEVLNKYVVDHDHATGKVRGILCYKCNTGLGNFRDSKDILMLAIAYLRGKS